MEPPSKKRRYPRVGLRKGIHIAWQGVGGRVVSQIATVGLGGLFIKVRNPPPVGDVIRVYFEAPDGEVRARAVVQNTVQGKGMGIQFTAMGPEARARLAQLLRRLMNDTRPAEISETAQR